MKIFKSCRTLSMFRFYEILNSKDYKYLIENYDEIEIDDQLKIELTLIWNNLFKEYIVLKDDKEIKLSFRQLALIDKLEKKLEICKLLLEALTYQTTRKAQVEYIKELSAWGYAINRRKPLQDEIDRITRNLKSLRSNILIKKAEFEKTHKKELKQEKINIDKDIVNVEHVLNKVINSEETMISKWIEYIKKAKEVNRNLKQKQV